MKIVSVKVSGRRETQGLCHWSKCSAVGIPESPKVPQSQIYQCPERIKAAEAFLILVADYTGGMQPDAGFLSIMTD